MHIFVLSEKTTVPYCTAFNWCQCNYCEGYKGQVPLIWEEVHATSVTQKVVLHAYMTTKTLQKLFPDIERDVGLHSYVVPDRSMVTLL